MISRENEPCESANPMTGVCQVDRHRRTGWAVGPAGEAFTHGQRGLVRSVGITYRLDCPQGTLGIQELFSPPEA